MRRAVFATCLLLLTARHYGGAQGESTFEVASIKREPSSQVPAGITPIGPVESVGRRLNESWDAKPTLFTAIRERLGLRRQTAVGPVEVIVIESVERPTED